MTELYGAVVYANVFCCVDRCVKCVFMASLSFEVRPRLVYCLLEEVKIHIEDHSVSSRVIFTKDG